MKLISLIHVAKLKTTARRKDFQFCVAVLLLVLSTLPAVRAASVDDEADQAFSEGERLRTEWKETSLRDAIAKFIQAGEIWKASRSPRAVDALRRAADIYSIFGDHTKSLQLNGSARSESQRTRDLPRSIDSTIALARNTSNLGRNDEARAYLEEVLRTCKSRGTESPIWKGLTAQAENALGEVYYARGEPLESIEHIKRAIALATEVQDKSLLAQALLNHGYALSNSGNQVAALEQFNQADRVYSEIGDQRGQAFCQTARGSVISYDGKEQEALTLHGNALKTFQTIGARESEGVTLAAMGQAYQDLGQQPTALDKYLEALQVFEQNNNRYYALVTQYKVAKAYRLLDEVDAAMDHLNKCLTASREAKNSRFEAYAMKEIAEIYHGQRRDRDTLKQYERILRLYRTVGDRRGEALTLISLGDFFATAKDSKSALNYYLKALALFRKVGDRDEELSTLLRLGKTADAQGSRDQALNYVEESIRLIETLRNQLVSPDMRASYFSSLQRHYDLYIQLLMESHQAHPRRGFDALALGASESARARTLVEILAEAGTSVGRTIDPRQLQQHEQIQKTLLIKERHQSQLAGNRDSRGEAAQLEREIRQLVTEEQSLQAQMRLTNPDYATLVQPQPLNLEQIQAELKGEDTLLLEFFLGERSSYLWAVTEDSFTSYQLPGRAEIESLALSVYKSLTARENTANAAGYQSRVAMADADYEHDSAKLSSILLGPVSSKLGQRRLLIVADGMLQYVPFDALPQPSTDLRGPILENEIISLPSVSALAALRRRPPPAVTTAQKLIAVFADPVFSNNDVRARRGDQLQKNEAVATERVATLRGLRSGAETEIPRLRYTQTEADRILRSVPSDQKLQLIGFDANRPALLQSPLDQYQILHFATHALIDSEHPRLSGIFLSTVNRQGERDNGLIALNDIYNLKLSAKLVVLSACSTGLGKDVKGEGLIGLTRGFMHAGSKSVVASLWKVDDRATSELMNRFYSGMFVQGLTPAAALKQAKESLRRQKRWEAPYYWAGFVLLGEYREQIKSRPAPVQSGTLALSLSVIGGLLGGVTILGRRSKLF